jgi:hypothetical protein
MKLLILMPLLISGSLMAAQNQSIHCQRNDVVRIIEVLYPGGTLLPCEVHYRKEGESQLLWQAKNESGYCEQKAAEFAEKQRGWGWQCVVTASAAKPAADIP